MSQITGAYTLLASEIQFRDLGGVNQLLLRLDQGGVNYTIGAPKTSEAMERGDHLPNQSPVKVRTGGNTCKGTLSVVVDQLIGTGGNTKPSDWAHEAFAQAAGLKSTLVGGAWGFEIRAYWYHAGGAETVIFRFCEPGDIKVDPKGADGKMLLSFDFEDIENTPLILQGRQL